jgi:ABC-2 type transport system permease protein
MAILPVFIFLLYRLMVSGINDSGILDIAVYDLGNSQLVTAMQENSLLQLHRVADEAALQEQIHAERMSGLLIPAGFDAAVAAGENPALTIWLNPQRGLQAETVEWQRFLEAETLKLSQQSLPVQFDWVDVPTSEPLNNDTGLSGYLLVIVLTMIYFMSGVNVVAMLIAEEKDKHTAVMLTTSPASITDIVWAKTVAGVIYMVVITAVVILINGGLSGNWPLVLLYLVLALPVSVSIGVLIGSSAQSAKQCSGWISLAMILFLIPAWFLTILDLPEPFGSIFRVIPSHFIVSGLNDALAQTAVMPQTTINLTVWTLFMLVMVALTVWRVYTKPQSIIA